MLKKGLILLSFFFLLSLLIVVASSETIIYKTKIVKEPIYKTINFVDCVLKYSNNLTNKPETICINRARLERIGFSSKEVLTKERIGLIYDNKVFNNPNGINLKDNKLILWSVPVGDRNYKEFGSCSVTEINRGVCNEN